MSRQDPRSGKVVPAQLSYLAIYNPELGGNNEESLNEQIVYWYSSSSDVAIPGNVKDDAAQDRVHEQQNEKLRQVGLAQGMVKFARTFGNKAPVDSIETEKHRIVLTELEPNWWIVASISLTSIAVTRPLHVDGQDKSSTPSIEYSSREVSTSELLLQQLRQANAIFLLHHSISLDQLWKRTSREKFCEIIELFWTRFVQNWNVLLNGNPAVDVFNGIKLAAGGELGIGVGEEEWGSGDREVLEGMIESTDGLIDMIVVRYGEDAKSPVEAQDSPVNSPPWLGDGQPPRPSDGVVFSGVGRLSSQSLRAISQWINSIFVFGDEAYAVRRNPKLGRAANERREREGRRRDTVRAEQADEQRRESDAAESPHLETASDTVHVATKANEDENQTPVTITQEDDDKEVANPSSSTYHITDSLPKSEQMMKYLTLGYGTVWTGFGKRVHHDEAEEAHPHKLDSGSADRPLNDDGQQDGTMTRDETQGVHAKRASETSGAHFIIGLRGDLDKFIDEAGNADDDDDANNQDGDKEDGEQTPDTRTIYVELKESVERANLSAGPQRLKLVVYAHQPFIFIFLFDPNTFSLTMPTFYHNLHLHILPLHKDLVTSTSPTSVANRLNSAFHPDTDSFHSRTNKLGSSSIFDLIFDRASLMIHSSIPNIPIPGTMAAEGLVDTAWTRQEALSVHSQVLNTYAETRNDDTELEHTGKTRHDWWIIWMRIPPARNDGQRTDSGRDALLIRRASGYVAPKPSGTMARLTGRDTSASSSGNASGSWRPTKLAEGIGVDARKYVESLLSLAR